MQPQLPLSIRWHGRGGQGVVTASRILAAAALKAGHYMQSLPDFGAERSGAPIAAHTRIDISPPAERGPIEEPEAVIVLDSSLAGQVDVTAGLKDPGALILNISSAQRTQKFSLTGSQELWSVDGSEIGSRLLGRNLPNTPVLGAFARAVPVLPLETIAEALQELMSETFDERIVAANLAALREGFSAVRRVREAVNA